MIPSSPMERTATEYRGVGGILRDIAAEYEDDDVLVAASAAQVLLQDPLPLIEAMADAQADVSIASNTDGTLAA